MISTYLPWLLSAITIWMTLLAGNKHPNAWLIGLGNQGLWLLWIFTVGAWGLLPMNIALWIVYGRNHWKWNVTAPKTNCYRCNERIDDGGQADGLCVYCFASNGFVTPPRS